MIGKTFGRLAVVAKGPQDKKWRMSTWQCVCVCGGAKTVLGRYLRNSESPNCGCTQYLGVALHARKYNCVEDYLANTKKKGSCLEWQGHRNRAGYASVGTYTPKTDTAPKRTGLVHRRVFELLHGWLPPVVMHTCDNPACIKPTHLVGGTKSDNTKDAARKQRLYSQKNKIRVRVGGKLVGLKQAAELLQIPLHRAYYKYHKGDFATLTE
jgi:HNH endonuclease